MTAGNCPKHRWRGRKSNAGDVFISREYINMVDMQKGFRTKKKRVFEMIEGYCRMCRGRIWSKSGRKRYCEACLAEKKRIRKMRKRGKPNVTRARSGALAGMSLAEVNALARENGMSYGAFVVKMEGD